MKKIMCVLLLIILIIGSISIVVYNDKKYTASEKQFYKLYKEYGMTKDNNISILDNKSLKSKLSKGNNIIYIGSPKYKTSTILISNLIDVTKDFNITLYYYDSDSLEKESLEYINDKLKDINAYIKSKVDYLVLLFIVDGKISDIYINEKEKLTSKELENIKDELLEKYQIVTSAVCEKDVRC